MKKGKEINLKLNNKFKTCYGTIDNKELKTIYVGISTWVNPLVDLENYNPIIAHLRKIIKNGVFQNLNSQLFRTDHHIIDIDVKDSRVEFNKLSYLNIEITLFVKDQKSILSNTIKTDMSRFINTILSSLNDLNNLDFKITKNEYVSTI